jgi:uncharacterized protein (DUF1501 family)
MTTSALRSGSMTRRSFLAGAGAATAVAGLTGPALLPRFAFASPDDPQLGDALVVLFLRGGADGLSLVVPYSDTGPGGYHDRRGQGTGNDVAIPPPGGPGTCLELGATNGGHEFGLHPGLGGADGHGGLMGVWEAGHLAVVHAVGLPAAESASRSHFESQDNWERGTADLRVHSGWLTRHLGTGGAGIPAIGWGSRLQASMRPDPNAISLTGIDGFGLHGYHDDARARAVLERLHPAETGEPAREVGNHTLQAVAALAAADPQQHAPEHDPYPTTGAGAGLSRGLRQIAMLLRSGVGIRAACIDAGGWDLHDTMGTATTGDMARLATGLGDALGAFHTDLGPLVDEVTVVVMSEFGRGIGVNGSGGTDHGRGSCCFVISGHAVPGVHGSYPSGPLAHGPEKDLAVTTDIRTVLGEVLVERCGPTDLSAVFPTYVPQPALGILD